MAKKVIIPKKNEVIVVFDLLPEEQRATETSLINLEKVVAINAKKNDYTLSLSENAAARSSLL